MEVPHWTLGVTVQRILEQISPYVKAGEEVYFECNTESGKISFKCIQPYTVEDVQRLQTERETKMNLKTL